MLDELSQKTEETMDKTLENLGHELATIRTGKASTALLDTVKVEYFGQHVPLKQVASIATPDARLITVQPWDKSIISDIEKAIMATELGLNPQNDGVLIRLPIPQLTEERRKDLTKVVKKMGEEAKVAIRNIRRDANDRIKKLEKSHDISEDNMHTKQEEIQSLTDKFITKIDELIEDKEKEIMEI